MLAHTLKSRGFAAAVHAGLWLLLYLTVTKLDRSDPGLKEADSFSAPPQSLVPLESLGGLFAQKIAPTPGPDTNLSPYFTRHFIPLPAPPPPPPPPPPTTRKIDLTYLGYYQASDSPVRVLLRQGDSFLVSSLGAQVATNVFVSGIGLKALTLTNLAGQTNILPVNVRTEIEVPIQ
jgi:hypothetical protein